jgi:hypothetical protein
MLKRVEGDDAERVVDLPRHQIGDGSVEVRNAQPAVTVDYKIDRLIRAVGHHRHD